MQRPSTLMTLALAWATLSLAPAGVAQLGDLQPGRNFPTAEVAFGPGRSENLDADAGDVDRDGDLDVVVANGGDGSAQFNVIYVSLADGAGPALHRTGTSSGGSQAPWDETPASGNGGTTLDGEVADIDNDGDPDLLLANDANQDNRLWRNVLGVPDTHAPTFALLSVQADKADGSETVVHAQLRDNSTHYVIAGYEVDLIWSVDGGFETTSPMATQGSQQFRGVIPAAVNGSVSYRVRATDRAGNTAVSQTVTDQQTSVASSLWQPFGTGTLGTHGLPHLTGGGARTPGARAELGLTSAAPNALDALFLSAAGAPVPFKGGTLFTFPVAVAFTLTTGDAGEAWLAFAYPSGVPSGLQVWWQHAVADAAPPSSIALSNAVISTAP